LLDSLLKRLIKKELSVMADWETPRPLSQSQVNNIEKVRNVDKTNKTVQPISNSQDNVSPIAKFALLQVPSQEQMRPKPQVACINPTPQLEVGALSPLVSPSRTTPRIPLGELNHSTLSQRLFHSPNPQQDILTEATSHYHQGSSYSPTSFFNQPPSYSAMRSSHSHHNSNGSNSNICHTQISPSPHTTSPSYLLQTQLPTSSRAGRDRRHQMNTEIQLVELKQQVEKLGNMLYSRQLNESSINSVVVYQQQIENLEQERDELETLLGEREHQLINFKNSVATLNSEYLADLGSMKLEAKELGDKLKEREDKYYNLEREHQKSLKTIHGLQAYIRTLPAQEEVRELKSKLEVRTTEISEMGIKGTEIEKQMENLREEMNTSEKHRLDLEIENKELVETNKKLQSLVSEEEKRRFQARNLGEEQVELLLFDKNELQHENQKLKNVLEWKTKKFEDEKHKLEEQVKRLGNLMEQSNKQLQVTNSQMRQANVSNCMLEAELKKKTEENMTMASQLDKFGTEIRNLKLSKESTARLDGHYTRLTRGMGCCIAELSSLNELCTQVVGGGDPNMSVLLGVKDLMLTTSPLNRDTSSLTVEDKLDLVRSQLEEVGRVQEEVRELRTRIADKYAENLADNMTSCVTQ